MCSRKTRTRCFRVDATSYDAAFLSSPKVGRREKRYLGNRGVRVHRWRANNFLVNATRGDPSVATARKTKKISISKISIYIYIYKCKCILYYYYIINCLCVTLKRYVSSLIREKVRESERKGEKKSKMRAENEKSTYDDCGRDREEEKFATCCL